MADSALAEELIAEASKAGMDLGAPVFGDDASTPSTTTSDDIIARFTGQDDAPQKPAETTAENQLDSTPVAQEVEHKEVTATPSFLQSYKDDPEFGPDLAQVQQKYGNDREALRGLLHATKLVGQRNDLATLGKALVENPQAAAQWLHQNHPQLFQPQPQPAQEPEPPAKNGQPSNTFLQLLRYVDKEKLDQAPESVREGIRQQLHEITVQESPHWKKVNAELEGLKQQLAQVAQQPQMDPRDYVHAALAQAESHRNAAEFMNTNREWIFANKQSGPLSKDGIVFKSALDEALQGGAQSDIALKYAMRAVNEQKAPSAKPAQTPNKKVAEQRPSTSKVQPEAADVPWDESLGFAGNAMNLAKHLGLSIKDMELSI